MPFDINCGPIPIFICLYGLILSASAGVGAFVYGIFV